MTTTATSQSVAKSSSVQPGQEVGAGGGKELQDNPRLALNRLASKLGVKPEVLMDTVSKTCFKECKTGAELVAGIIIADRYQLDPFLREFTVFPAKGGGVVPVVMIDGWIRLVQRQATYRGHKFTHHKNEVGKVESITCEIHIDGRDFPIEKTEYMSECSRDTDPWKKWPIRMLEHKSFIQCARYAFGFGGIYDSDEAARVLEAEYTAAPQTDIVTLKNNKDKRIDSPKATTAVEAEPVQQQVEDLNKKEWEPISAEQRQELLNLAARKGNSIEAVESYIKIKYDISTIDEIPNALLAGISKHWEMMPNIQK